MQYRWTLLALAASLLFVPAASGLAEFGIEGMGVVSTPANEARATLSPDSQRIVWASDRAGGAGGMDVFVARWDGQAFVAPAPLSAINSAADELDATWLGDGRGLVWARGQTDGPSQLMVATCKNGHYGAGQALALSFNGPQERTFGAVVDAAKPGELLVTGSARAPRAGQLDIYRMKAPVVDGDASCR